MKMVRRVITRRNRPPLFSESWWTRWREVYTLALHERRGRSVARLRTAAAVGLAAYASQESFDLAAEMVHRQALPALKAAFMRVRAGIKELRRLARYAIMIIAV